MRQRNSATNRASELANFCEVWGGGHLACDLAGKLSCIEAEAIAGLLTAAGDPDSGQQWIRDHSWADRCGDLHCRCVQCTPHTHTFTDNPNYCDECGKERAA